MLKKEHRGFALLLSIIVSSVVLAIGVSILKISVNQLQLSATARESEMAFQASQSLTECLKYRAAPLDSPYRSLPFPAPMEYCMGTLPRDVTEDVSSNFAQYSYVYEWGTDPQLCGAAQLYIMDATDGDVTHQFPLKAIGDSGDGWKTCDAGGSCAVLVTQGYNRPCDQLSGSIFTIQRELTSEF